jgi:hypothetical protein
MTVLDLEEALQLDIIQRLPLWPHLTPRHGVPGVCAAWRRLVAVCVSVRACCLLYASVFLCDARTRLVCDLRTGVCVSE